MIVSKPKYTFSGHESFQCRNLWLKKGYDYVNSGESFTTLDAMVALGVGKNMVSSIRFWLKAFNIIDNNDHPTALANLLFKEDEGWDEFLEDEATLWLLHYQLIKSGIASTYSLIFNELRKETIEFTKEKYIAFVRRRLEGESSINEKTIADDFDVFRKMYLSADEGSKSIEDSFSGLLTELRLVKSHGKGKEESFSIEDSERESLPAEILIYSILENPNYGLSISINNLMNDYNGPASIFSLNRAGLMEKIYEAMEKFEFITYTDHAGVKELQFRENVSPITVLSYYYEK
jgi:hypothetical protein